MNIEDLFRNLSYGEQIFDIHITSHEVEIWEEETGLGDQSALSSYIV